MAKIDKILGSISPLYGIATGKGLFGKTSPLSMLIHGDKDKKKDKKPGAAPVAGEGMKRGGKAKKYAKGGVIKKAGGGAMQGPPASTPAASGGGYDRNRLGTLNAPVSSKTSPGMTVRPSFKGGKPGIKVKGSFAKGGSVSSRADGCAKKGKTKGRFI